jgi:hypothetical protein
MKVEVKTVREDSRDDFGFVYLVGYKREGNHHHCYVCTNRSAFFPRGNFTKLQTGTFERGTVVPRAEIKDYVVGTIVLENLNGQGSEFEEALFDAISS